MTGAFVAITIVFIGVGGTTATLLSYYRLQRHRNDAIAMAGYRKLAEQAVAGTEALHAQLRELTDRLAAVEQLLRSVG